LDQFTYVKRGYDPEEVDKYISTLEQVIKSYKDKDNAIKNAIISAQVAADNVMRNAQMNADAYKAQIGEQLVEIRGTLDRQRMALQSFQEAYANMVRKSIQELEQSTTMTDLFSRLEEAERAISELEGLEAVSGPTAAPAAHMPPPVVDDRSWDAQYDQSREARPAIRDFEQPREYGRETPPPRRDMRDVTREDIRDVMRPDRREPMQAPLHETLFDTDRDIRPPSREYDPHRENVRSQSRDAYAPETMHSPERDMRSHGRDAYAPEPREMTRSQSRDNMYHPPQEPMHREIPQDVLPHGAQPQYDTRDYGQQWDNAGRDYMADSRDMRRDVPREARRDMGRDSREMGRDVRREPNRDMIRTPPPMRQEPNQPMRDLNRPYMPDAHDYPDNEQNLLPPVASLM